ncbi:MAG: riboflavin synthase [Boseongicola sp. SB0662_bin_57]|nr:riboflavin synthase [Boseongicola sp. SB0662_bin_57]
MFTGIVTGIGEILSVERAGVLDVRIGTSYEAGSLEVGASIACDGVCLTLIDVGSGPCTWFAVQASEETLSKTNLSQWEPGRRINLERALKVGDEIGGHIVSGHVDGIAVVRNIRDEGDCTRMVLDVPHELARFIAPKGSVALNGTSLTVNEVDGASFDINLIPHTRAVTTWGEAKSGDKVNLEIDTLARYVARLNEAA